MDLNIKVGVDAAGATKGLADVKNGVTGLKTALVPLESEFDKVNRQLIATQKFLPGYTSRINELKDKLAQLAPAQKQVTEAVRGSTQALAENTEVVKKAETSGNSFAKGLGAIFGGLRKIAYLIPGIGLAGLIGLLVGPAIDGFKALYESIFASSIALQKFKDIKTDIGRDAGNIGAGDIARLELLRTKITDLTLPLSERNKAIKEYNSIADASNQIDAKQISNTGYLNDAISRQIELIGKRAIAKAFENKLTEAAATLFDADQKVKQTAYSKEIEALQAVIDEKEKSQKQDLKGKKIRQLTAQELKDLDVSGLPADLQKEANDRLLAQEKIRQNIIQLKLTSEYKEYQKEKDNFEKLKSLSGEFVPSVDSLIDPTKFKKAAETVADVLAKLKREIGLLTEEQLSSGIDKSKEKISAIESAIKHLVDTFKVDPKGTIIQKLLGDINDLSKFKPIKIKPEDLSKLFFDEGAIKLEVPAFVELEFKKSLRPKPLELKDLLPEQDFTSIVIEAQLRGLGVTKGFQDGIEVGLKGLRFPELKALFESATQRIGDLNSKIAQLLKDTTVDVFVGIGESLGKAIAGGFSAQDVFGGIFDIIADGLKAFGKALIEYGVALKVIKLAIKNPTTAILAGIALIAAGALLQSAIPKFAQGVENFGGGLAVVGERGPELVRLPSGSDVIPNHRIGGVGAATNVFIPDIKIRGNDLLVVFNRASQTAGRNS